MIYRYVFIILVSFAYLPSAQSQNLLSQYEFNGDLTNSSDPTPVGGNVAPDGTFREGTSSSTAIAGTPTFVTGVDGSPNGAIHFDGIDDWIDITIDGHPGAQTGTDIFTFGPGLVSGTVMGWVKVDVALNAGDRWLMGSLNANNFQSFQVGWDGGQLESRVRAADTPESEFRISDATHDETWADDQWHHVAISWDAVANNGNIYIDGNAVGSPQSPGASLNASNIQATWEFPMAIGARNSLGTINGFWHGAVDDLRIYAEALTPLQIQTIFDSTPVATIPDFNNDLIVDGIDFLIWQRNVGTGTSFAQGDANNSGTVDEVDLSIWRDAYGQTVTVLSAVQSVPEPGSISLSLLSLLLFPRKLRRLIIC